MYMFDMPAWEMFHLSISEMLRTEAVQERAEVREADPHESKVRRAWR